MRKVIEALAIVGLGIAIVYVITVKEQDRETQSASGRIDPNSQWADAVMTYRDGKIRKQFTNALEEAGIPHRVILGEHGTVQVGWDAEHEAAVQRVQEMTFSLPLPAGRHVSLEEVDRVAFIAYLRSMEVEFDTVERLGIEYLVWDDAFDGRVRRWEHFPED